MLQFALAFDNFRLVCGLQLAAGSQQPKQQCFKCQRMVPMSYLRDPSVMQVAVHLHSVGWKKSCKHLMYGLF